MPFRRWLIGKTGSYDEDPLFDGALQYSFTLSSQKSIVELMAVVYS